MKTIEESAIEYCSEYQEDTKGIIMDAFNAGAKFAQEWIPVGKGLPESGRMVLIKDKNNMIGWSCIRFGDWDHKFKNTITHWRPITKR